MRILSTARWPEKARIPHDHITKLLHLVYSCVCAVCYTLMGVLCFIHLCVGLSIIDLCTGCVLDTHVWVEY